VQERARQMKSRVAERGGVIFRKMSSHEAKLQRSFPPAGKAAREKRKSGVARLRKYIHSPVSLLSAFVFRPCFRLLSPRFSHTHTLRPALRARCVGKINAGQRETGKMDGQPIQARSDPLFSLPNPQFINFISYQRRYLMYSPLWLMLNVKYRKKCANAWCAE